MKNRRILCVILMFLPLLASAAAIGFLPDQIPAHYGFDGNVDRWGSKYEAFIFPAVIIGMGLFILAISKVAARQEPGGSNNERVSLTAGILMLAWFNLMNGYGLYTDFTRAENLNLLSFSFYSIECILLGVIMVLLGNVMPKLKMNSVIGLRTSWSMKNDDVWKRCQRFGGISFIIAGILVIAAGLALRGPLSILLALLILLADAVLCIFYSYAAAKDAPSTENK